MKLYNWAGIGARKTPANIIKIMRQIGFLMAVNGGVCHTGAAKGADQAFAEGAARGDGIINLSVPWGTYEAEWIRSIQPREFCGLLKVETYDENIHNFATASVHSYHPAAHNLSQGIFKLHARNYLIIAPCKYVICWATLGPDGLPSGGTGQGCRIAESMGITVYNLFNPQTLEIFMNDIRARYDELPNSLQ